MRGNQMNPKYKILKLKSGEEMISTILKVESEKLTLRHPMVFKSMVIPDPYTGIQKEITILRDWISYSSEDSVEIPADYIVTFTLPEEDAIELYQQELEKKKSPNNKKRSLKKLDDNLKQDLQKELEDLLDSAEDEDLNPPSKSMYGMIPMSEDFFREMMKGIENISNGEFEFEFDFSPFPPEELNPNESTENELNHPDFGNRWTDWSSNPNEY